MNRFTDLSHSVRDDIAAEDIAKETDIERKARLAKEKRDAAVKMLNEEAMPILEEARDGLASDSIKAIIARRDGDDPAAILQIEARTTIIEGEGSSAMSVELGEPGVCTVTTGFGVFLVAITGPQLDEHIGTSDQLSLDELIMKAVRKLLRRHHRPFTK